MVRQQYRSIILIVAVVLAAVYFFILSKSGLLERLKLDEGKSHIVTRIENLKSENNLLRDRLKRYKQGEYPDTDILESGYLRPGGKVIFFQGLENRIPPADDEAPTEADSYTRLPFLRLVWLAFSAAVLIGLIIYGRNKRETSFFSNTGS
ncbi:MAG: hypothetical protein A2W19_04675 [Spirochaetes bacterium RBG_16_49_21]|nr:MAG: hypothetical protein A2W19_04675 [Spirochaetes bacterium RBG_16_49_21]